MDTEGWIELGIAVQGQPNSTLTSDLKPLLSVTPDISYERYLIDQH